MLAAASIWALRPSWPASSAARDQLAGPLTPQGSSIRTRQLPSPCRRSTSALRPPISTGPSGPRPRSDQRLTTSATPPPPAPTRSDLRARAPERAKPLERRSDLVPAGHPPPRLGDEGRIGLVQRKGAVDVPRAQQGGKAADDAAPDSRVRSSQAPHLVRSSLTAPSALRGRREARRCAWRRALPRPASPAPRPPSRPPRRTRSPAWSG